MYKLVVAKKKDRMVQADYYFDDFMSFYARAANLLTPFCGRYKLCVKTDDIGGIQEFLQQEKRYAHLDVYIYTSNDAAQYLMLYDQRIRAERGKSDFEVFKELVSEYRLLFEKKVMLLLYNSIEHNRDSMLEAVRKLKEEYGSESIDEKKLMSTILIKRVTYPRTALLAFLKRDRYRWKTLRQCISDVGGDVALGACRKNIKTIFADKAKYLKTGKANWLIKELDAGNIDLMYRVLYLESLAVKDITVLMEFYERGISPYDFVLQTEPFV